MIYLIVVLLFLVYFIMRYKNARKIKSRKTIEKFSRKETIVGEENERIMALMLAAIMMMAMSASQHLLQEEQQSTHLQLM